VELFQRALYLMKNCHENCDASCYRCLRSFKNKFEHSLLDRHVGAQLLEYLLNGEQPEFNADRLRTSTEFLFNDLLRQGSGDVQFELNAPFATPGGTLTAPIMATAATGRHIIALSGPLTTDHPADSDIASFRDNGGSIPVIVENELIVRGNLPWATRSVLQKIGVL
jgi:hypothetical protein